MKLSEMTTRQAAACMAELAAPIGNLLESSALKDWYEAHKQEEVTLPGILPLVPVLLREHYDDASAIVAALTGKTRDEIDGQLIGQTIADVRDCLDDELISFFKSARALAPEK